jgi:hypothetical protein
MLKYAITASATNTNVNMTPIVIKNGCTESLIFGAVHVTPSHESGFIVVSTELVSHWS